MKRFPDFIVALTFICSVAASILYTISLHRILGTLREHDALAHNDSREYAQEISLNNNEVALNFSNDFFEISADEEWESIQLKLLPVDPTSGQAYVSAMHQQIYCLDTIRKAYLSYHLPRPKFTPTFYLEAEKCLEQLRQTVLCNADITLEPTTLTLDKNGTLTPASSGTGIPHRCKNWQRLNQIVRDDGGE
ncbi:hypothetical protein GALMADRAFT_145930 [Galerina marginata CBS 339.88]|uniref:Uncharacterized protein n=1 Tax=Galerina marginata (strain CBS 339.88) TaxID=685588 RepID=A0A067SDD7_GALM3|nr:hypothetical protein GALMADRAFT_145930 [Galerina marginata CBS 339.88]